MTKYTLILPYFRQKKIEIKTKLENGMEIEHEGEWYRVGRECTQECNCWYAVPTRGEP
jgi:hypothetical protein